MMNDIKEIELGPQGVNYIKECLADGKTLSKLLLEYNHFETGKVVTYLPSNTNYEAANDFQSGGKLPSLLPKTVGSVSLEPVPNTDSFLAEGIQTFLNTEDRNLCIFEDASASPNDPFLRSVKTRFSVFEDEVYHLVLQTDIDKEKIIKTIRQAQSWLFIGVMTSTTLESRLLSEAGTLTQDELKMLANRAEKIIVGAYDGESYIIWSKS